MGFGLLLTQATIIRRRVSAEDTKDLPGFSETWQVFVGWENRKAEKKGTNSAACATKRSKPKSR